MKKLILILLSMAILMAVASCTGAPENTKIQLVNKMTAEELSRVDRHELTLFDEPIGPMDAFQAQKHTVQIEKGTKTKVDLLTELESLRGILTEEEYREIEETYESLPADFTAPYVYCLVDGHYLYEAHPLNDFFDGNAAQFTQGYTDENGQYTEEYVECASPEEYYEWLREDLIQHGESETSADITVTKVRFVYDAYISGNYESLPEGSVDPNDPSIYDNSNAYKDYRDQWEYDYSAVKTIRDSIEEISIYDEEMNVEFLVHAVLPPDYDPNRAYPVFFLTDGVYRFGNTPQLRQVMEDGSSEDVILVTLGYGYHMNGRDEGNRFTHLIVERAALLDFITDNLMPYLGEIYNIDYIQSAIYGHSNGGVFTHYALFNSDRYENQPFGHYIIGSPAFWCLYENPDYLDVKGYESNYGYFERNTTLNKSVFLCGGSFEDPDYADRYNGHASTLEGLEALNERLESYGADVTYKLYESHHYQYIPDMLIEYLRETYPA